MNKPVGGAHGRWGPPENRFFFKGFLTYKRPPFGISSWLLIFILLFSLSLSLSLSPSPLFSFSFPSFLFVPLPLLFGFYLFSFFSFSPSPFLLLLFSFSSFRLRRLGPSPFCWRQPPRAWLTRRFFLQSVFNSDFPQRSQNPSPHSSFFISYLLNYYWLDYLATLHK